MNRKNQKKYAFSLIELSIVILIISIIISGSLSVSKTSIRKAKIKITKERLTELNRGLANYLIINRKLPCPASLVITSTSGSYAKADGTDGVCTGGATAGVYLSTKPGSELVYGMIPTKDLGLSNDMAEDGFGTKFSYVIDRRFTTAFDVMDPTTHTASFEGVIDENLMVEIQELSSGGTSIVTNAVFAVISHGPNKFGGYAASATSQNITPTIPEEADNASPNSPNQANFDHEFVINATNQSYDDILLFKTRIQIARDAKFEDMLCPDVENNAYDPDDTTPNTDECTGDGPRSDSQMIWDSGYYFSGEYTNSADSCSDFTSAGGGNCGSDATNDKSQVKCGKYGQWGQVIYKCKNTTTSGASSSGQVILEVDKVARNFTTNWADGAIFDSHAYKANSRLLVNLYIPMRNNDSTNWGGAYTSLQYRIGTETWKEVDNGNSGYSGPMGRIEDTISTYTNTFLVDPAQSSDYDLTFKLRHRSYSGTLKVNAGIPTPTSLYGRDMTGDGQYYTHVIIQEILQ